MKRSLIAIFLIVFIISKGISQNLHSKKVLAYELGKTGLVHNLYFDNKFSNSYYGYRIGIGSNLGGYLYFGKLSIGFYKLMGKKK